MSEDVYSLALPWVGNYRKSLWEFLLSGFSFFFPFKCLTLHTHSLLLMMPSAIFPSSISVQFWLLHTPLPHPFPCALILPKRPALEAWCLCMKAHRKRQGCHRFGEQQLPPFLKSSLVLSKQSTWKWGAHVPIS